MKIPTEVLEQYNISVYHLDDEIGTYDTFLKATDYAIIKSFELLMSDPTSFLTNLIAIAKQNTEVMRYRAIAREEISKAKGDK